MNVDVVARKEFNDAIRSYALITVTALFFLLTLALTGIYTSFDLIGDANPTIEGMIGFATSGATVFVPLIAIVLSYKAIVGERNSGSLALILSLPNSRQDVFFGKFVGRSAILLVAIGAAFLAGLIVAAWQIGLGGIATFVMYIALLSLLGFVYVAIGLALSGTTNSSIISGAVSVAILGLFRFAWTWIWWLLYRVVSGEWLPPSPEETPDWVVFGLLLNPHNTYGLAVDEFVYGEPTASFLISARALIAESGAFFASPAVGLVLLLGWIAVPLAIGFYRFDSTDL